MQPPPPPPRTNVAGEKLLEEIAQAFAVEVEVGAEEKVPAEGAEPRQALLLVESMADADNLLEALELQRKNLCVRGWLASGGWKAESATGRGSISTPSHPHAPGS